MPTPQQIEWHNMEIGMFIHWAPNVYQDQEYDDLSTPPEQINPSALDTDQWVSVAKSLGAKYIVMVAKHVGGYCLWQTDTTEYSIKNSPWRDGKGDVLRDLSESCRKQGLKMGVYLSPQDVYNGAHIAGRCASPEEQEKYNQIYRQQLVEVLSRYGEIFEVWFDGGQEIEVGDILEQYAPNSVFFQSKHASIRWVGNEEGIATYPAWNAVGADSDAAKGLGTIQHGDPDGELWIPLECDTTIRKNWFWNTANASSLKSLEHLMELYYRSVGNGAVLLLNANPDRSGLIPAEDAQRAKEFGDEIKKRFSNLVGTASGTGNVCELNFAAPEQIDHIVICEDIQYGERIRAYEVSGFDGTNWIKLCSGTAVGHKRIERVEPVTLHKLRLHVLKAAAEPQFASFSAYYAGIATVYNQSKIGSELQKIGEWGPELFQYKPNRITVEKYELTDLIGAPGQYKLYLTDSNTGPCEIRIAKAKLMLNHAEYPQFVSGSSEANEYIINITALGQCISIELELHAEKDIKKFGNIWIERATLS